MDYSEMFPGRFLKSQKLTKGDATLTIVTVKIEKFPPKKKGEPDEVKGIVTFKETPLQWMLNKTNASCLAAIFGRETKNWIGKRVTLWPAPFFNQFTGEHTTALRVRGSPDMQADKSCKLQIGREVIQVTLKKTMTRGAPAPQPSPPPPAAPAEPAPPSDEPPPPTEEFAQ